METATIDRPPPTGEGLTFEKVWAMFQENERKSKEDAERYTKEHAERMKEYAERQKEIDRIIQENKERWKKTERFLNKVGKQVGELNRRFGEMAEHLVAPSIHKRFNELGYHFSAAAPGGYIIRDLSSDKILSQVDILLINDDYVIAVEVKATVRLQDVEHHIKRLEILKEHWSSKFHDSRIIRGAIAGAIFGEEEKKAVIEAGFYALVQSGDTMKMEIPEGFVPREF